MPPKTSSERPRTPGAGYEAARVGSLQRVPPHSREAEQALLAVLLRDHETLDSWERIAGTLSARDFYCPEHQLIFETVEEMYANDQKTDFLLIVERLDKTGALQRIPEGMAYLGQLAGGPGVPVNAPAYARTIQQYAVLRELIRASQQTIDEVYEYRNREHEELVDSAESRLLSVSERRHDGNAGLAPLKDGLIRAVDKIDEAFQRDGVISGLASGFVDLDEKTTGFQPGDLIIVAGRPSMGKTAFSINMAEHVAIHEREAVAVFSMEMPAESLAVRMISSVGRVEQQSLRTGNVNDDDWPKISSAVGMLAAAQMYIDDSSVLTPVEIRARVRRLVRQLQTDAKRTGEAPCKLGMIVIDYLQLMDSGTGREMRAQEVGEISRALKRLAMDFGVPVVALSQLNRSLESRPNKRPMMSDLRESGALEQDADVIIFLYRDEVYNEDSPDRGTAEAIIGKQRNGPIGTVRLTFNGRFSRFENYAGGYGTPPYGDEGHVGDRARAGPPAAVQEGGGAFDDFPPEY